MTDTENQERIAQVRARLSAATPGPWHAPSLADGVRHLERNCSEWYGAELPEGFTVPGRQNGDGGQRDGEFIANAPTDVAFLLSRVDSLESALRKQDAIFRWLLGEEGEFPDAPEDVYAVIAAGKNVLEKQRGWRPRIPLYWWRVELQNRLVAARADTGERT